jgi:hypothetical protein
VGIEEHKKPILGILGARDIYRAICMKLFVESAKSMRGSGGHKIDELVFGWHLALQL